MLARLIYVYIYIYIHEYNACINSHWLYNGVDPYYILMVFSDSLLMWGMLEGIVLILYDCHWLLRWRVICKLCYETLLQCLICSKYFIVSI